MALNAESRSMSRVATAGRDNQGPRGAVASPDSPVGRPAGAMRPAPASGAGPSAGGAPGDSWAASAGASSAVWAGGPTWQAPQAAPAQRTMPELLRQLRDLVAQLPPAGAPPAAPRPAQPQRPYLPPPAYGNLRPATGLPAEVQLVVDHTNRERARHGLRPLVASPALSTVAAARSADMVRRGYFDHTDPDGRSPFWHVSRAGINYSRAAENIAYGQRDAAAVVDAWMRSPGHRANILNPSLGTIGVGLARDGRGTPYWTQLFTN
ncbi:MAG: CAP domain-containing protein [Candidatus Sericytochromatia bacterium]|nr:CAP domain-containing protein [Candidatus Tanganyikabacteria bacterium]